MKVGFDKNTVFFFVCVLKINKIQNVFKIGEHKSSFLLKHLQTQSLMNLQPTVYLFTNQAVSLRSTFNILS
jgi:hypothetical protein